MSDELREFLLDQRRHYLAMADKIAGLLGLKRRTACPVCGAHLE